MSARRVAAAISAAGLLAAAVAGCAPGPGAYAQPAGTLVGIDSTPYTYQPLATSTSPLSPTATGPAAVVPTTSPTALAGPSATPERSAISGQYVVLPGDTLWEIAAAFGLTVDELVAANPGINPDMLLPDQVLIIPDALSTPVPDTGPPGSVTAYVSTDGERLRLRAGPSTSDAVITVLDDATSLHLEGRSDDFYWLEVTALPSGLRGWVMRQYVETLIPLERLPVTFVTTDPGGSAPSAAIAAGQPHYAYIENITPRAREIFLLGQGLGNRPNVFSKVGDSITDNNAFLVPIGTGDYNLRDHTYLQPVIDYFSQATARDGNSFANTSLAAKGGWSAWQVREPGRANPELCRRGETPLICEYRLVRPSIALIMLGTNDVMTTPSGTYESWMREIVETSIEMGVIPVLSTIPDFKRQGFEERVPELNGIIRSLALEYQVPLWDYWASLQDLPEKGLSEDGIHPGWAIPADFKPYYLQYGMTMRNLTALQALDAIWREVILAGQTTPAP